MILLGNRQIFGVFSQRRLPSEIALFTSLSVFLPLLSVVIISPTIDLYIPWLSLILFDSFATE
jgi:hypothetical protein